MRSQYKEATTRDESLKRRVNSASRAAAIATDVSLRRALAATPAGDVLGDGGARRTRDGDTRGDDTSDGGARRDTDDHHGDHDGDYDDGYHDGYGDGYYNGWNNWYWNSAYPYWNSWYFGFIGWGWGWGYGYGYYNGWGYNPAWSWPYYSPGYGYYGYWPSYAYVSPAVIYNYYEAEQPIIREVVDPGYPEVLAAQPGAQTSTTSQDFSLRAASEYMGLGDRAFSEGRYGDAVHYYAKAIQFAPEDGVLYLVLSDALFATGDYHYAAFALRRALTFNPELASLGLDKRTFYGTPEDFQEQLDLLARFVGAQPMDTDARIVLAANYLFSLQPELAINVLDQAPGVSLRQSEASQQILAASAELLVK